MLLKLIAGSTVNTGSGWSSATRSGIEPTKPMVWRTTWKNIMHTFRLLDMALDIARERMVRVRRPNASRLLEVREGKFTYDEIITLTEEKLLEIREAFEASPLPEEPDREEIAELLREVQVEFGQLGV